MVSEESLEPITFWSYPELQFQCGASFLVPKVSRAGNKTQACQSSFLCHWATALPETRSFSSDNITRSCGFLPHFQPFLILVHNLLEMLRLVVLLPFCTKTANSCALVFSRKAMCILFFQMCFRNPQLRLWRGPTVLSAWQTVLIWAGL